MPFNIALLDPVPERLSLLKQLFNSQINFNVIKSYERGKRLLDDLKRVKIDLIVTSEVAKDMTAYSFIVKLMDKDPKAVLIIEDSDNRLKDIDFPQSLDYNIVDSIDTYFDKDSIHMSDRILVKAKILARINISRFRVQISKVNHSIKKETQPRSQSKPIQEMGSSKFNNISINTSKHIVIFGASTGGPRMLISLISQLPSRFPPVIIIQHMPRGFASEFAKRMHRKSNIRVKVAEDGEIISSSTVYIAPGGYHLDLERNRQGRVQISLDDGPKVNFVKPALDVTLFGAARTYRSNVISAVLSGMGTDGKEGNKVVKKKGGYVIALQKEDSLIYGMNKGVIEAGLADKICSKKDIIGEIVNLLR